MQLRYIEDYYEKVHERFPDLEMWEIEKILKHGMQTFSILNSRGADIIIKSAHNSFTMYFGKLFNNKEIVLIIGERKSKKNEKFYYYRLEKFKFNFIKKYRSFIKIIIIPLLVANGLSAIIYGVFRYFHKYITFWLNKNGLIHFLEKFSDKSYKNELINSLTIGIIFLYLTITICIYVLPFWINKFDEFVRKLLIVEAIGVNLLTAVIILSGLADKSINKYVCFFLLVTWIVFNMIEVIIWVYRWMLEDKNTNGIPRTQLIITIIFGILSFVVGKLWR